MIETLSYISEPEAMDICIDPLNHPIHGCIDHAAAAKSGDRDC